MKLGLMGGFGSRAQALASAAAAVILDDSSGGRPDGDEEEAGEGEGEGEGAGEGAGEGDDQAGGEQQPGGDNDAGGGGDAAASSGAAGQQAGAGGCTAEQAGWFDSGVASRNGDIARVFESDVCAGREAAAAELLAAGLEADQVIKTLGKLPKGTQGDAMLETLRATAGAPQTAPGAESNSGEAASGVWDRVAKSKGWNKDSK